MAQLLGGALEGLGKTSLNLFGLRPRESQKVDQRPVVLIPVAPGYPELKDRRVLERNKTNTRGGRFGHPLRHQPDARAFADQPQKCGFVEDLEITGRRFVQSAKAGIDHIGKIWPRMARIADERAILNFFCRDRRRGRQWITFGQGNEYTFLEQKIPVQTLAIYRRAEKTQIDAVTGQLIHLCQRRTHFGQLKPNAGMLSTERRKHRRQKPDQCRINPADPEPVEPAMCGGAGEVDCYIKALQHSSAFLQKHRTRLGQADMPGCAEKQGKAQFFFQVADLGRQRRLRKSDTFRSAAEVQFLRYRDETSDLPEIHRMLSMK